MKSITKARIWFQNYKKSFYAKINIFTKINSKLHKNYFSLKFLKHLYAKTKIGEMMMRVTNKYIKVRDL